MGTIGIVSSLDFVSFHTLVAHKDGFICFVHGIGAANATS